MTWAWIITWAAIISVIFLFGGLMGDFHKVGKAVIETETNTETPWSNFRWGLALRVMRIAIWLAPEGTAKNRWGEYQRGWIAECRAAWNHRYPGSISNG